MEEKYIYRKHLREPGKIFLFIGLMFIVVYVISSAAMILDSNEINKITLFLIILAIGVGIVILMSLEFLFIYFTLYKKFKNINVTLTDDGIIYKNSSREIIIPYENINALKFPSIKYTGGWVKIKHSNGNIRLTVVLENIGDMVKRLKNELDERNMSTVYNEKAIYKFFKTATYCDQSWGRIYDNVKFLMISLVANVGVGAIFSGFITDFPVKSFVLIISVVGPILPFIISEIIIARKLAKQASKENFSVPKRDKLFENIMYKWSFGVYTVIYFIVLIVICVLN